MAKITLSEHKSLAKDGQGHVMQAIGAPLKQQTGLTAPNAANSASAAFDQGTDFIRACSDVAVHCRLNGAGDVTAATVNDDYYPAGAEIVLRVPKGGTLAYIAG